MVRSEVLTTTSRWLCFEIFHHVVWQMDHPTAPTVIIRLFVFYRVSVGPYYQSIETCILRAKLLTYEIGRTSYRPASATHVFKMFIFQCQKKCWPAYEQINVLTCEKIQILAPRCEWDSTSSVFHQRHDWYLTVNIYEFRTRCKDKYLQ